MTTGKRLAITLPLLFSLVLFAASGSALASHTPAQLEKAGFVCFPDGPSNFVHCLRLEQLGNPSVPVKVFSPDAVEFLGTELLLRDDIYRGQPCPQDGIEFWDYHDDIGYFACHHFYTDQH